MPRKKRSRSKHLITRPDVVYNSVKVRKFTNMLMKDGKYTKAYGIVCDALEKVYETEGANFTNADKKAAVLEMLDKILEEAAPMVEVKSKRIGGATYQVPREVSSDRRMTLAVRWILQFSRKRSGKNMVQKLADEMRDVLKGTGATMRKKDETHRMAKANLAFAYINR